MTTEELQKFCSTDETRQAIMKPFSIGNRTFATCGRMMIWVDRIESVPERSDTPEQVGRLADAWIDGPWEPIPSELPPIKITKCNYCDGLGEDECNMGHVHSCNECDGTGFSEPEGKAVKLGNKNLNNKFLFAINTLPNAEIAPTATGEYEPCPIRFTGGRGLLMPMKVHQTVNTEQAA